MHESKSFGTQGTLSATIVAWVLVALVVCGTVFLRLQAESSQVSYTEVEVRVVSVRREHL
ncbi:hypothetical protein [Atopobium sp. oral taxon 416]|uniref:hypothetical protein n=1 Tax=Atopobium sp. oral taxon 416 TaxID=712157 RepID=UPI001BAD451B|nr:hypothetical protein [Atopobium sp. oral taxon 416]QUC03641.1 hypothetical protein J4859_01390 [Atopobium sp. oral taxon 416]